MFPSSLICMVLTRRPILSLHFAKVQCSLDFDVFPNFYAFVVIC